LQCKQMEKQFSHSLYLARDEMAAEYDELFRQIDYVFGCVHCRFRRIRMMLKKSIKALDNSNKLKLSVDFEI
ncbi:hypothetical protein T05_3445, partial [Trichinella murrelli]